MINVAQIEAIFVFLFNDFAKGTSKIAQCVKKLKVF
jgi:hypothetical protein